MQNNEERRDIAARLRNAEIENLSTFEYSTHLGEAIGECVRLVSGHEFLVKRGLNRLADLIEPEPERTCKYIWDADRHVWFCSECGGLEQCSDSVNYCCDCGARVIGNIDEREG